MERIFVSYHFDQDRPLFGAVESMLRSHGILATIGDNVGGGPLTASVMKLIDESQGLIALMTRGEAKPGGGYNTHPWVHDEYTHARTKILPSIALIEKSVVLAGAYQEHERIDFDPAALHIAYLKLFQTIGIWKREAGVQLKVRILPEALAKNVAAHATNGVKCSYRIYQDGIAKAWKEASIVREYGGAFAYLKGVVPSTLIEVQIQIGRQTWYSEAVPQFMHIELKKARP